LIAISLTDRPHIRWKTVSYSETAIGSICLAICILADSTFNGFSKELSGYMAPLSLIFVSELLTALFISLSFGLLPTIRSLHLLSRPQKLSMLTVGMLAGILGPLLFFTGIAMTTAVNAGFFARFEMLFMIGLAHFFLGEKVSRVHWIGGATILSGIMMIALRGFTDHVDIRPGDLIIVAGIFCYSSAHVIYRSHLRSVQPHIPLLVRSVCAMSAFFLVSPFIETPFIDQIRSLPSSILPALIGFALISRFLSSMTFYQAIDRLPITAVSLASSLTIIGSTLFAWLYVGESVRWYHFAGAVLVILGNALVELLGHQRKREHVEQRLTQRMP
jgi:drug/metabolite transporter (DMT)-like permease